MAKADDRLEQIVERPEPRHEWATKRADLFVFDIVDCFKGARERREEKQKEPTRRLLSWFIGILSAPWLVEETSVGEGEDLCKTIVHQYTTNFESINFVPHSISAIWCRPNAVIIGPEWLQCLEPKRRSCRLNRAV